MREARARYLADNGFGDGGYEDGWVRFKVGPLPVAFPNTASRKRAVPLHDLHHVATGYGTDLRGEAEIASWELAAGCERHIAAWVLNLMALPLALLAPRRVWAAWQRGRASRSLYRGPFRESLLDMTVGQLRSELGLA